MTHHIEIAVLCLYEKGSTEEDEHIRHEGVKKGIKQEMLVNPPGVIGSVIASPNFLMNGSHDKASFPEQIHCVPIIGDTTMNHQYL